MPRLSDESRKRNLVKQRSRNARSNANRKKHYGRLLTDVEDLEAREFVGWDGEGYTEYEVCSCGEIVPKQRYMLFGNSRHNYIAGRSLGTRECLDLLLDEERKDSKAIHVGFATEYDVNMILKDLGWRYIAMLYDTGSVVWNKYRIKHTPDKMFQVSKDGVSMTLYNVFGFFHSSYVAALEKYKIGDPDVVERIKAGKSKRSQFTLSDFQMVYEYWAEEISLLPPLMEKLRLAAYSAGFFITEWHGPGALASYALKQNNAKDFKSREKLTPTAVKIARQYAYAGGRFESFKAGLYIGSIYTADINSAYAYAASLLPRLDNGRWRRETKTGNIRSVSRFGLYEIEFSMDRGAVHKAREWGMPMPLFHRDGKGRLTWPTRTRGWYWSPEAATVIGSPYTRVLSAWVYEDDGTRPFEWIGNAYNRRLQLQETGHPAEKAYKWMLAAMYGQWAQRVGWDKEKRIPPPSHQLEWAGFITSLCRALVFRAAIQVAKKGGLISIDTDGVTSSVPFEPDQLEGGVSNALGAWKLEEYSGILYWQNGIYWLRNKETWEGGHRFGVDEKGEPKPEWQKPKTRGIPRGSLPINDALERIGRVHDTAESSIVVERSNFVGYGQAMQHQYDSWRMWVPRKTEVTFGGTGKGIHVPSLCVKCTICGGVPFHTITHIPPKEIYSRPHKLPWLDPKPEPEKNVSDLIWRDDCL